MIESIWIGDEYERTVYANPNFCNLLGYSLEEILGRESYDFWDDESIKIVKRNNELRKE
jgi:PAS domain S-box-containing protein